MSLVLLATATGAGNSFTPPPGIEPETGAPAADRLIEGSPVHTTWNEHSSADEKRYAGMWQSTPGKWRIIYDEWEYCEILEGESRIGHEDGRNWTVKAGDRFVIEPGFTGWWQVVTTTTKRYVISL